MSSEIATDGVAKMNCVFCGKLPSGQIRRIHSKGEDTRFISTVKDVWGIDIDLQLEGRKYCVKCFNHIEKSADMKHHLLKEMSSSTSPKNDYTLNVVSVSASKCPKLEGMEHPYSRQLPFDSESKLVMKDVFRDSLDISDHANIHVNSIIQDIRPIIDALCSKSIPPGPSILRERNNAKNLVKDDLISEIILEMHRCTPSLLQLFTAICSPSHILKEDSRTTVATVYAMLLHCRNSQLSALQVMNTCSAIRYHASNNLLQILHKSHVTLSDRSKLGLLDRLGSHQNAGIIASIRQGRPGKITTDNIDGRTIVDAMRFNKKNKDYHYTASTYYPDRLDLGHLSVEGHVGDVADMSVYFVSDGENEMMMKALKVLVGRLLLRNCPNLQWLKLCIPNHIEHEFTEEMSRKSEVFPLKVIFKDPKYLANCVDIASDLTNIMETCYDAAGQGDQFDKARIPLGGDQLVRVRFASAKGLRAGLGNGIDRREQLTPIITEFFHVQQDYLEKTVKNHYNADTAREVGTLAYFRNLISRTNVNGVVKGRFKQHEDFMLTVTEALLLHVALKVLGMDSLEDTPTLLDLPSSIEKMHKASRSMHADRVLSAVVEQLHERFLPPAQPTPIHFQCHDPDVGPVHFQVLSDQLRPGQTVKVVIRGKEFNITVPDTLDEEDHLRNYTLRLIRWMTPYMIFRDAVKEGNPFLTSSCLKSFIPAFYAHSRRSKYAVECIDYILQTESSLSPQLAMRTRLGSFVNTLGGKGGNKPADMQQENNVRAIKEVFKGLGASKTEKAMERSSSAAPILSDIVDNYERHLGVHISKGTHTHVSNKEDVALILHELSQIKPLDNTPGRKLRKFRVRDTVHDFNGWDFYKYLTKTVHRLALFV